MLRLRNTKDTLISQNDHVRISVRNTKETRRIHLVPSYERRNVVPIDVEFTVGEQDSPTHLLVYTRGFDEVYNVPLKDIASIELISSPTRTRILSGRGR